MKKLISILLLSAASLYSQITGLTVSPSSTSGITQTFSVTVANSQGGASVSQLELIVNTSLNPGSYNSQNNTITGCTMLANGPGNGSAYMSIYNAVTGGWAGDLTQNGQGATIGGGCTLTFNSISSSGNTATYVFTLTLPANAPAYNIYVWAQNTSNQTNGFTQVGTWNPTGAPSLQFANASNPQLSPNLMSGDGWVVFVSGPPNTPVTVSGSVPTTWGPVTLGNTDSYGHFSSTGGSCCPLGPWVENWTVGSSSFPVSFNIYGSQFTNTSEPSLGVNLVQGDGFQMSITGPSNSPVLVSGTANGTAWGPINAGTTDGAGHFTMIANSTAGVTIGTWVETWTVGNAVFPLSFQVFPPNGNYDMVTSSQVYYPESQPIPDDYTGGTVTLNSVQRRFKSRHGSIEIRRADNIDVGEVKYEKPTEADGSFTYRYSFDNSQVEMVRLGEITQRDLQPIATTQPEGWYGATTGWSPNPLKSPARSKTAAYSITSKLRPGVVPLQLAGEGVGQFAGPEHMSAIETEFAASHSSVFLNSQKAYVIGPVFRTGATAEEIMASITKWSEVYGMTFLQPLIDGGSVADLKPSTQLEMDAVEALKMLLP
jgi:hypothetical protein